MSEAYEELIYEGGMLNVFIVMAGLFSTVALFILVMISFVYLQLPTDGESIRLIMFLSVCAISPFIRYYLLTKRS